MKQSKIIDTFWTYQPSLETMTTRAPGDEVTPHPKDGERLCFVDFVNRGFAFPVHEFFRALMYTYGVQLHDFTPNSMLHIACFIVLCECFLGIHPHWGLWQRIFNVKRNAGFGIQPRGDIDYFYLKLLESTQNWRKNGSTSPTLASRGNCTECHHSEVASS